MTTTSLPDYQVRISPRARRVRIKVTPLGQVEVVLPPHMDSAAVPDLLYRRRDWLHRTLAQVSANHASLPGSRRLKPSRIELAAIDEVWQLDYIHTDSVVRVRQSRSNCLTVKGRIKDVTEEFVIAEQLRGWLQRRARSVLPGWLASVSQEVRLPFNKVTVRGQKTRWGSCSTHKNINLNRNLLFLAPDTVRYLFLHELCHTIHMNHSRQFWQLVERHMPDFRHHEKVIREATKVLPLWVYA